MTAKRGAPAVASLNKASARKNIEAKIHAIESLLALQPPSLKSISSLPPSLRQFNLWKAARGSLASSVKGVAIPDADLMSNARQTLVDNPTLAVQVDHLVGRVKLATSGRRLSGTRTANLEARLAFVEKLRKAAETALSDAQAKIGNLQMALVNDRTKFKELVAKSNAELRIREEELQDERNKVSELTRQLRDVSKFRNLK
jgi:hypothetical protein